MASPRQEASTFKLDLLTFSQVEAIWRFVQLVRTTLEYVKEIDDQSSRDAPGIPAPIGDRHTRLIFWSGEAGLGKTSAYVSIRSGFEETPDDTDFVDSEQFVTHAELATELKNGWNRERVLWLEPIDLEPLMGQPNFLAAVAARINHALRLESSDGQDSWLLPGGSKFRDAQVRFLHLTNEIALSWEGNLPERGGSLEPDVYAAEVMRAEKARLNVNRDFGEVIKELAQNWPRKQFANGPPVFVLPIDDFYLKQEVTLELLRFLRMISCPHLVVLMLGDIDTVEKLLTWQSVGEAGRLMGERQSVIEPRTVLGTASSLASAAKQKLIPPGQTVKMTAMEADEALRFSPRRPSASELDLRDRVKNRTAKLAELLKEIDLEPTRGGDGKISWYWSLALELPARHVHDLHEEISRLLEYKWRLEKRAGAPETSSRTPEGVRKKKDDGIKRRMKVETKKIVAGRVISALEEDRELDESVRDAINAEMWIDEFDIDQRKFPYGSLQVVFARVDLKSNAELLAIIPLRKNSPDGEQSSGTLSRKVNQKEKGKVKPSPRLRPRALGWLAVLHDLACDEKGLTQYYRDQDEAGGKFRYRLFQESLNHGRPKAKTPLPPRTRPVPGTTRREGRS